MSRHLNSASSCRHHDVNPYQPTTVPIHKLTLNKAPPSTAPNITSATKYNLEKQYFNENTDTGLSEDSFIDSYYDFNNQYKYSDTESNNSRLRFYEKDDASIRRFSRNTTHSDRSNRKKSNDQRRIYPNPLNWEDRFYHDIQYQVQQQQQQQQQQQIQHQNSSQRSQQVSERPQSTSTSSGITTNVDGCGGQCQTAEKFLYFFMQLLLTMLVLTGISFIIAGLALRKSAARNVQVLVYIGLLITLVSSVLLQIQWRSWQSKKKRRLAMKNAKRTQIPMENLTQVPIQSQQFQQQQQQQHQQQQQLLHTQLQLQPNQSQIHHNIIRVKMSQRMLNNQRNEGIPWWRRRDVTNI